MSLPNKDTTSVVRDSQNIGDQRVDHRSPRANFQARFVTQQNKSPSTTDTRHGLQTRKTILSRTVASAQMKAVVCTRYGPPDVLELKEIEKPAPKDDEVQIRVYA